MSGSSFAHEKRKSVRSSRWPDNVARIDTTASIEGFKPRVSALVIDESEGGYSIAVLNSVELDVGDRCSIETGGSGPQRAEVVRVEGLSFEVKKLGLKKID